MTKKPQTRLVHSHGRLIEVYTLPGKDQTRTSKRQKRFVQVPWRWIEKLSAAPLAAGATWAVACHLNYLDWKNRGKPFRLPNGALEHDGISRHAKYRALVSLEERDLITVDRRTTKSPTIHIHKAN